MLDILCKIASKQRLVDTVLTIFCHYDNHNSTRDKNVEKSKILMLHETSALIIADSTQTGLREGR